jgi:hypothetical protein
VADWFAHFCVWDVLGSNLSPETGYSDGGFLWFSSVPSGKFWGSTLNQVTAASFHVLSNLLFINHPIIQGCFVQTSLKKPQINKQIHPNSAAMHFMRV